MDRYWIGTGGNYSSTANWSDTDGGGGGFSVPTSTDNVFFTASSGDCIVNVSSSCLNLDFTGYTNTITTTDQLNIFGSSITKNLRTIFLRPQYLTETINFMTASGIVDNATIYFPSTQYQVRGYRLWEIMDEHIRNLKGQGPLNQTYNLWDKMIAVYPFVGGSAAAHKFNLINPLDTDAAFRLDYVNSLIHSGAGVTGAASAYALTNIIPSTHLLLDDVHISNFLSLKLGEYYEMGIFGSGGDLYKRTRMDVNYPPGIDSSVNAPYVALRTTGNQVILSRLSSTTVYAYNDGVSSNAASTSTTLSSAEFPLFCIYNISTYNNNTLSTHIYDTIGYGLTDAEAAMFYTVVNDLQKKLKRQ